VPTTERPACQQDERSSTRQEPIDRLCAHDNGLPVPTGLPLHRPASKALLVAFLQHIRHLSLSFQLPSSFYMAIYRFTSAQPLTEKRSPEDVLPGNDCRQKNISNIHLLSSNISKLISVICFYNS